MVKLISEPGHGANTWPPSKGTRASGGVPEMAEHDFNAAVADETKRLLNRKINTFSTQPSRQSDVPLNTRIRAYNAEYSKDKSVIGMSHHGNANGNKNTRGFGVFYWHTSAAGKKLAQMILAEYKREFPDMPIWGTGIFESKRGDWTEFAILRDTAAPFVLIEWEFFTNDAARKIMLTSDYRNRCGKVAAKVACDWHGVKFEEATPVEVSNPISKPSTVKAPSYPSNVSDRRGEVKLKADAVYRYTPDDKGIVISTLKKGHTAHYYDMQGHWVRLGKGWVKSPHGSVVEIVKEYQDETLYRISVDGEPVNAFGNVGNILSEVQKAVESGSGKIAVEKV